MFKFITKIYYSIILSTKMCRNSIQEMYVVALIT